MAKRKTPRAEANDAGTASPTRTRRAPVPAPPPVNTSAEADTIAAYPGVERSENDGAVAQATASPSPGSSQPQETPSDDEIRERAYHRFLERGAHQGNEFDDWVEAERDLRSRR